MIKKILCLNFILIQFSVFAGMQNDSLNNKNASNELSSENILPKPKIGLGTGMFSYFGEISNKKFANPMVSRVAYDLGISEDITDFLNLRFYVLFGKLGANERSLERNLNFESSIRLGGVNLTYNFNHFLNKDRIISPYISTGIETFEFLSKTDLKDANGNTYYYWKDGSIRNISEDSPDKATAILLQRDYTYESDLREANLDKAGKYGERSWAIPVGAGAIIHVSDRLDFKIGTAVHFTFTDNIDNISTLGDGVRKGDSKNDRFVMSSFSLHYQLFARKKYIDAVDEGLINYLASDADDEDGDGVIDLADDSPFTPKGETVDTHGVPLDNDKDLIFNFRDEEVESTPEAIVNAAGVAYTDTMMALEYAMYMDSTGAFATVVDLNDKSKNGKKDVYKVQLGAYKSGVPPELINKYLSIKDLQSNKQGDSVTVYTAGNYNNFSDADKRKTSLVKNGIKEASVVMDKKGQLIKVNTAEAYKKSEKPKEEIAIAESDELIFRVQVGAYRGKISKEIFGDLPNLISIQGENGITRYVTGNYDSYAAAAKAKVDILLKGFEGAFVVAYRGGKRIPLQSLGVKMLRQDATEDLEDSKEMNTIDKKKIHFSIQLGNFSKEIPAEQLNKYIQLKDIEIDKLPNGNTRYSAGNYADYKSALARKNELISINKITDAFIIAFFNGRQINLEEAQELLNK